MRFLLPVGGIVDKRFGILTTPGHRGIPAGIVGGMDWAADNQVFTKGFNPSEFFPWLESLRPYHKRCLFIPVKDVIEDARATLLEWEHWGNSFIGWPRAFVAQDGQEDLALPQAFDVLFIGGTTKWKLSHAAEDLIQYARLIGKRIHIGRVNWWKRYEHFAQMHGSEEFTCDGTRTRFDGTDTTIIAWANYMVRPHPLRFYLSGRNYGSTKRIENGRQ